MLMCLSLNAHICVMDGMNVFHFCHFLESVASCFGKHCGKSHETRDEFKCLAPSCSDSLGQLPGRSCVI